MANKWKDCFYAEFLLIFCSLSEREVSALFTKQIGGTKLLLWRRCRVCRTKVRWLKWVDSYKLSWAQCIKSQLQVRYLSRVQHPNIIRLFATCIKGPNICLIMEYGEGGSLYNLLHCSRIPYTASNAMSWCRQCADVSWCISTKL